MRPGQQRRCRARRKRTFTLIEVVASLVLLGTTVVAVLSAQTRALQQARATERQAHATRLARELVAEWQLDLAGHSTMDESTFPGHPAWRWRRTVEPMLLDRSAELKRVQLEILYAAPDSPEQVVTSLSWLEPADE